MLTVPQEFHDYSRAPERRTDLIVRLDPLSWPTGINAHGTAHSLCMPIQWDKSPPHRLYATGEYNRTPLDGRALVNGWAGQVYGYLSNALSDQDGLFMKDTVKLSCTRNGGAISVLTICFDPAANEYAVDFDVTIDGVSSTETYHQEWHIRNNDQPIVYITGIRAAYDTVTVMVSKWSHPFHRARIREIANGVLFEATGDSLYSCNLISESDPTNQSIPTGECALAYPDPQGMFDVANPNGVASAVRSDQIMTVWIGVSDGQHKPVYAKVGAYYCPKATSKGGTGELHAVDILGKLQGAAKPNARSLDHLHNQSLADFVLGLGASPWIPATDFTGSAPTAFDKGTNRLECLRYVSQYLHKLLYVDADGNARLTAMSRTPVAVIPLDQSYEHPSIEAREELGGIVDIQVAQVSARLTDRRITLDVTDSAREWLANTGYDPAYGARPLRRLVQTEVGDQLAEPGERLDIRVGDEPARRGRHVKQEGGVAADRRSPDVEQLFRRTHLRVLVLVVEPARTGGRVDFGGVPGERAIIVGQRLAAARSSSSERTRRENSPSSACCDLAAVNSAERRRSGTTLHSFSRV